jgi:hypothetical protein
MIKGFVLLSFITGVLTVPVVWGAIVWVKESGLQMNGWKWLLAALWYTLLLFFVFMDFTLIGEGEVSAGWKLLAFEAVVMIILGVGLVRLISRGRKSISG